MSGVIPLCSVHITFGDAAGGTLKTTLRDLGGPTFREKVPSPW